jgi:hypothetical protein
LVRNTRKNEHASVQREGGFGRLRLACALHRTPPRSDERWLGPA